MSDGRLYRLLPAIYRERDEALGRPLAALLAVMEEELATAEAETAAMYENAFVETADEAALLRLAALVGVEHLATVRGRRLQPAATRRQRHRLPPEQGRTRLARTGGHRRHRMAGAGGRGVRPARPHPAPRRRPGRPGRHGRRPHPAGVDPVRDPFPVTATRPDVRCGAGRSRPPVTVDGDRLRLAGPLAARRSDPARRRHPPPRLLHVPSARPRPAAVHPALATGDGRPGPAQIPRRITRRLLEAERDALFGAASGTSIAVSLRGRPLGPADVDVVDLGDWTARPTETNRVALDPERGRLGLRRARLRPAGRDRSLLRRHRRPGRWSLRPTGDARRGDRPSVEVTRADGEDAAAAVADAVRSAGRHRLVVTVVDDLVLDAALELVLVPGADVVIQAADATRPALGRWRDRPRPRRSGVADAERLRHRGGGVTIAGAVQLRVTHCTRARRRAHGRRRPRRPVLRTSSSTTATAARSCWPPARRSRRRAA